MVVKNNLPTVSLGLMIPQAVKVAQIYLECNDWVKTKEKSIELNIMQVDRLATASRYVLHAIRILQNLGIEGIKHLSIAEIEDQRALLWLAFCRTYPLVGLFASDVIHQRFLTNNRYLYLRDWDAFLSRQADEDNTIDNIGKSTRDKARSVIFSNLRQACFLSSSNELKGAEISEDALRIIGKEIIYFPISSI